MKSETVAWVEHISEELENYGYELRKNEVIQWVAEAEPTMTEVWVLLNDLAGDIAHIAGLLAEHERNQHPDD